MLLDGGVNTTTPVVAALPKSKSRRDLERRRKRALPPARPLAPPQRIAIRPCAASRISDPTWCRPRGAVLLLWPTKKCRRPAPGLAVQTYLASVELATGAPAAEAGYEQLGRWGPWW
jgi:hypothetical protein